MRRHPPSLPVATDGDVHDPAHADSCEARLQRAAAILARAAIRAATAQHGQGGETRPA